MRTLYFEINEFQDLVHQNSILPKSRPSDSARVAFPVMQPRCSIEREFALATMLGI